MRKLQGILAVAYCVALAGCATQRNASETTAAPKPQTAAQVQAAHYQGTPAPGSKFARLRMGMSMQRVEHLIGMPTSQSSHITGKQFIPFYFGGDTYRVDAYYRGEGELTFSPAHFGAGNVRLIYMRVNRNATGTP